MNIATRKELTIKEKKYSYSKYYNLDMTPIPVEKLEILKNGPIDSKKVLKIHDRNDLLKEGYLECEVGYCIMEEGTGFLANKTFMQGVTVEMFEWWFAWHSLEDLRYRIWDPEDHFYARTQNRKKVLNKSLPMRERTWGTKHIVLEDIGPGPDDLILEFESPDIFGYDLGKVGSDSCGSMMCANGHGPEPGKGASAFMTHMIREVDGGSELRSRFWIGYQIINGQPVKVIPDGMSVPIETVKGLFAHNLKEFTHLATILPKVYEEEKDNF
ncbi:phloretin hydrolase [Clostridium sp. SHJSY1]|uniref:DAPG hydrolase family protein n=1 Tax=Clostridium sp. SHJSY1 TaxID=2942483 RepID=UPI0028746E5E|nr:phloretin hydrolase [Clostridium sp. SHJSY1]MDS0528561.1 phloretin hydrolase [Clostridium sp. SHJSY1]